MPSVIQCLECRSSTRKTMAEADEKDGIEGGGGKTKTVVETSSSKCCDSIWHPGEMEDSNMYPSCSDKNNDNGTVVMLKIGNAFVEKAMIAYIYCYLNGTLAIDMLSEAVNAWIAKFIVSSSSSCSSSKRKIDSLCVSDIAACFSCRSFLLEPVTVPCGHTFCKRCLNGTDGSPIEKCVVCDASIGHGSVWSAQHVSVVVANVLQKWWPRQYRGAQLRHEGNVLVGEGHFQRAIEKYDDAYEQDADDVVSLCNRSRAFLSVGKCNEALADAEVVIKLRPDCSKGYHRKGAALVSLGRYEDAAVAYLQCLVLEPNIPSIVVELVKVLHKYLFLLTLVRRPAKSSSVCGLKQHDVNGDDDDSESERPLDRSTKRPKLSPPSTRRQQVLSNSDFMLTTKENEKLCRFLVRCEYEMDRIKKIQPKNVEKPVNGIVVDKQDLECTLCYRLFWEPVTTPCGHVFCRNCLDRCLDHFPRCPLCKTSLEDYLAERRHVVTELIDKAMQMFIPNDYAERQKDHEDEMNELVRNGEGEHREIPIFICTVGFPTIPCPLHVFEPRYRLMVRRCMESGARQFGMCATVRGSSEEFANYGTLLEIRSVQYFPDGRSVLDTVGRGRFHVLRRGMKDGYHTAKVESLRDRPDDDNGIKNVPSSPSDWVVDDVLHRLVYFVETRTLHDTVHREVTDWFENLSSPIRNRIVQHFGPMPVVEDGYLQSEDGPAWTWWTLAILPLDPRAQLAILAMKSLKKRLEALHRTLDQILARRS